MPGFAAGPCTGQAGQSPGPTADSGGAASGLVTGSVSSLRVVGFRLVGAVPLARVRCAVPLHAGGSDSGFFDTCGGPEFYRIPLGLCLGCHGCRSLGAVDGEPAQCRPFQPGHQWFYQPDPVCLYRPDSGVFGPARSVAKKAGRERVALWIAMLAGAGAAVASESRAVLLVLPLACVFYFFFLSTKGIMQRAHVVWVGIAAVVLAGSVAFVLKDRLRVTIQDLSSQSSAAADSSIGTRFQIWSASARVFLDHPWLGVGRGNLPLEFKRMADSQEMTQWAAGFKHSHNEMLFLLAETGIAGALAVLAVYVGFLVAFFEAFSRCRPANPVHGVCRHRDHLVLHPVWFYRLPADHLDANRVLCLVHCSSVCDHSPA